MVSAYGGIPSLAQDAKICDQLNVICKSINDGMEEIRSLATTLSNKVDTTDVKLNCTQGKLSSLNGLVEQRIADDPYIPPNRQMQKTPTVDQPVPQLTEQAIRSALKAGLDFVKASAAASGSVSPMAQSFAFAPDDPYQRRTLPPIIGSAEFMKPTSSAKVSGTPSAAASISTPSSGVRAHAQAPPPVPPAPIGVTKIAEVTIRPTPANLPQEEVPTRIDVPAPVKPSLQQPFLPVVPSDTTVPKDGSTLERGSPPTTQRLLRTDDIAAEEGKTNEPVIRPQLPPTPAATAATSSLIRELQTRQTSGTASKGLAKRSIFDDSDEEAPAGMGKILTKNARKEGTFSALPAKLSEPILVSAASLEPQRSPSREPSPSLSTATRNTIDSAPDSVATSLSAAEPKYATASHESATHKPSKSSKGKKSLFDDSDSEDDLFTAVSKQSSRATANVSAPSKAKSAPAQPNGTTSKKVSLFASDSDTDDTTTSSLFKTPLSKRATSASTPAQNTPATSAATPPSSTRANKSVAEKAAAGAQDREKPASPRSADRAVSANALDECGGGGEKNKGPLWGQPGLAVAAASAVADDAALGPSLIGGRVEQENPPPRAEIENVQTLDESSGAADGDEDMTSKPVLTQFESGFSDRLANAIQRGPVFRQGRDNIAKRPSSMSSISSGENDGKAVATRPTSVVSTNDELGPATIASRIAQIGNRIPLGPPGSRRPDTTQNGESGTRPGSKAPAQLPPTAVKERPKGPARRAPTRGKPAGTAVDDPKSDDVTKPEPSSAASKPSDDAKPNESKPVGRPSEAVKLAPSVPKPAPAKKSLFESSSEDELFGSDAKGKASSKPAAVSTTTTSSKPPVAQPPANKSLPAKKKGLFDDSDSDSDLFGKR